jgi:ABC-2 type transport system permease protein
MSTRKLFYIALKDVRLIFRDRSALILMLLAPFLLTIGMGAVTGRFSGSNTNSGIADIPLVIVNADEGQLGSALVEMFTSTDLDALLDTTLSADLVAARAAVDNDESAAVIFIPAGFTDSIIPPPQQSAPFELVQVEFYANPNRPTSAGIVRAILDQFLAKVEVGRISGEVTVTHLLKSGLITPEQAPAIGMSVGQQLAQTSGGNSSITLKNVSGEGTPIEFDILSYMAPGMALMFLMFTVTYGGRSLLVENRQGTLARLLVSPTTVTEVMGGKVTGIFLTGVMQLLILIGGTSLLFQLKWGDPLAVLALVLAAAFAATGWGMIIAALLKTPGQIASVGSAVMLIFGLLGGSFFDVTMLPNWVQTASLISPNTWGMRGFLSLARGGTIVSVTTPILALVIMGGVLFIVAVVWITKRGLAGK